MGPAAVAFSNAMIKMSKLQAAQVGLLALQPPHRLDCISIASLVTHAFP